MLCALSWSFFRPLMHMGNIRETSSTSCFKILSKMCQMEIRKHAKRTRSSDLSMTSLRAQEFLFILIKSVLT